MRSNKQSLKGVPRTNMRLRICLSLLCFLFYPVLTNAQNSIPVLNAVHITNDPINRVALVKYKLQDEEEDSVKITVQLSTDGGYTFAEIENAKGDVGYPVAPGDGKEFTFIYPPNVPKHNIRIRIVADDLKKPSLEHLVAQVSIDSLRKTVKSVYGIRHHKGKRNKAHLDHTRMFLQRSFDRRMPISYVQDSIVDKLYIKNFVGLKSGILNDSSLCILGAHYDTVEKSLGADDNASGIAGMLEVMRILSPYEFQNSVEFVAFDLEEAGTYGSSLFVFDGGLRKNQRLKAAINLDMIGFCDERLNSQKLPPEYQQRFPGQFKAVVDGGYKGNFILSVGIESSATLVRTFESLARTYVPDLRVIPLVFKGQGEDAGRLADSDHRPFWDRNLPAIYIGDGADSRNPNYHSAGDTIDTLNFEFMSNVVKATVATYATIANILHATSVTLSLPN